MIYTVRCGGIPIGTVHLAMSGLSAGRLVRLSAYDSIAGRVRAASQALWSYGFYGPSVSVIADSDRRRARGALHAAAALRLELSSLTGSAPDPTFVSLVEAPGDGQVVVIAGFRAEPSAVGASSPPRGLPRSAS